MNTINNSLSSLFDSLPDYKLNTALIQGSIASGIVKKRHEMGLTQHEFAKQFNVTQGMVSKWESADYNFSISSLTELMSKLEIPFDIILNGESATNQEIDWYEKNPTNQDWSTRSSCISLDFFSTSYTKGVA